MRRRDYSRRSRALRLGHVRSRRKHARRDYQAVRHIESTTGLVVVPHLSCLGVSRAASATATRYRELGVHRIVALRGDKPREEQPESTGPSNTRTSWLAFSRIRWVLDHRWLLPEFHPRAPTRNRTFATSSAKVRPARRSDHPVFFNNDAYSAFVDSVRRKRRHSDHPGLMRSPTISRSPVSRVTARGDPAGSASAWNRSPAISPDRRRSASDLATRQVEDLLRRGAPGIHFTP